MPEYRINWEIELHADSRHQAAAKALAMQRDPDSIATVFDVIDAQGTITRIDLAGLKHRLLRQASTPQARVSRKIVLSRNDWTEIYYAVELKRLSVAKDHRQNRRHADGVDLAAWRRQMERIADTLGTDGARMHEAITTLIESADSVVSRWGNRDLQFAVQDLDAALVPFGFGSQRRMPK